MRKRDRENGEEVERDAVAEKKKERGRKRIRKHKD